MLAQGEGGPRSFGLFLCWFGRQENLPSALLASLQIPYRLKETDNEFDSFSQVPESPIGREEEPHLYMVAKKYRKVVAF